MEVWSVVFLQVQCCRSGQMALQVTSSLPPVWQRFCGFPLIKQIFISFPWRSFSLYVVSTSTFNNSINWSTCSCPISPLWGCFYGWCPRGISNWFVSLTSLYPSWPSEQELILKSNLIFLPVRFSFLFGWKGLSRVSWVSCGLLAISFKLPVDIASVWLVLIEGSGALQKNKLEQWGKGLLGCSYLVGETVEINIYF